MRRYCSLLDCQADNPNSYILISQEEQIQVTVWNGLSSNTLQRLETAMLQSEEFKLINCSSDAQILQFIGQAGGGMS
jgi:hypothetical protein